MGLVTLRDKEILDKFWPIYYVAHGLKKKTMFASEVSQGHSKTWAMCVAQPTKNGQVTQGPAAMVVVCAQPRHMGVWRGAKMLPEP